MIVGIPKEIFSDEARVAVIPSGVAELVKKGFEVVVESGAGERAHTGDEEYREAGAEIAPDAKALFQKADIVLKVRIPTRNEEQGYDEADLLKEGSTLICLMDAYFNLDVVQKLAERKVRSYALEFIPRTTRAQSMDVLSSMAAIGGYRGVVVGAAELPQYFPMLMTAAGTIRPAKVFVVGAGVAGLMAISTARRLGAVVEAYDLRTAAREQVESLGAKFVEFDLPTQDDKATGGYAKAQSEEFYRKQQEQMAERVAQANLIVTTAAIPGKPSPRLITADMVKMMKKGSVIVDLAAERGGNVEGTVRNEKVVKDGITIIGYTDHASRVSVHASQLYTKNITTFLFNMANEGKLEPDMEDEIVSSTLLTDEGKVVHSALLERIEKQEESN